MPPIKCCVCGCNAPKEQLFCFPMNDMLRSLWMSFIVPINPHLVGLSKEQLRGRRVCKKHFDQYQFDRVGKRILYSYPCLFTDDEIAHGVPFPAPGTVRDALSDHNYFKGKNDEEDLTEATLLIIGRPGEDFHEHPLCLYSKSVTSDQEDTEDEPAVGPETEDGDGSSEEPVSDGEPSVKLEMLDIDEIGDEILLVEVEPVMDTDNEAENKSSFDVLYEVPIEKADPLCEDETTEENMSALYDCGGSPGSALGGVSDEAPHAGHMSLATLHESRRASRMTETQDNTAHTDQETYVCDMCNKQLRAKSTLMRHIEAHVELKRYSCHVCSKMFKRRSDFNQHKRIHAKIKPYRCGECKKQFTKKGHFEEHIRIHTGVKPYSCGECMKQFTQKGHLNKHKIIHTGIKPYSCGECKKQFASKSHLDEHERIHTGVKPYSCAECMKQFTQKSALTRHKIIHSGVKPYSCAECMKQFTHQGALARHERLHSGVKPYSCAECMKQFTHKSALTRHKIIHSGVKPYSCAEGTKQFTQKVQLLTPTTCS